MFLRLFLLFSIIPMMELALLIKVGGFIGLVPTILIVAGTGIFGAYLARTQGFKILGELAQNLHDGQIPADNIIEGVLVLIGAVLLITPGLITDTTGFIFIFPVTRKLVARFSKRKILHWIEKGQVNVSYGEYRNHRGYYSKEPGTMENPIDVDFQEVKE